MTIFLEPNDPSKRPVPRPGHWLLRDAKARFSELVRRVRSEQDRRVVMIRLTPQGRALAKSVPIEPMQAFRRALETLSQSEQKTLLRILSKLETQVRDELARGKEEQP